MDLQANFYKTKSLISEISDVDVKNGVVTGYFASFGNVDNAQDMIVRGAFSKTIMERGSGGSNKIKHLLNHNSNYVLGKPQILREDNKGLYFETKVVTTTFGKDTLLLYAEGVYDEHSIGYRVMKWEKVPKAGQPEIIDYYKLLEIYLYEGSTVAFGCNPETPFTGLKGLNNIDQLDYLNSRMNKLAKAMKIGQLTDETLEKIEIEYKQIQQLTNDVIISLRAEKKSEPLENTQVKANEPKQLDLKYLINKIN